MKNLSLKNQFVILYILCYNKMSKKNVGESQKSNVFFPENKKYKKYIKYIYGSTAVVTSILAAVIAAAATVHNKDKKENELMRKKKEEKKEKEKKEKEEKKKEEKKEEMLPGDPKVWKYYKNRTVFRK